MDIAETLLNRISIYGEKIKEEQNIGTKTMYMDELVQTIHIIKEIYRLEFDNMLKEES